MDEAKAREQLAHLNGAQRVVRIPLVFKAQLGIGSDAYSSMWLGKRLQQLWDVGGVAATGAGLAKSTTVASMFFSTSGWLSVLGIGGAAVTPIGWVAAAAIASAGAYYGVTRLVREYSSGRVIEIPVFINTPLDILAAGLLDLIAPLALRVAHVDGSLDPSERQEIYQFFVDDWGYDPDYVDGALDILIENNAENCLEEMSRLLAKFTAANPDCNPVHLRRTLVAFLRQVAEADGTLTETEEVALERIQKKFRSNGSLAMEKLGEDVTSAFVGGARKLSSFVPRMPRRLPWQGNGD